MVTMKTAGMLAGTVVTVTAFGTASHASALGVGVTTARDPLQVTAEAVQNSAGAAAGDPFGGVAIDEKQHVVVVLLTSPSPAVEAAVAAGVPDPQLLRFQAAAYSWQSLRELRDRVDADQSQLLARGISVTSVGLGFGHVDVTVAESDPQVVDELMGRYGPALHVTTGQRVFTEAGRWDPPPYYGGMEIDDIGNTSTAESDLYHDCTNGYIGYRMINGFPFYQVITAGHCFNLPANVYHSVDNAAPVLLGAVNQDWYYSGSDADTLSADIRSGHASTTSQIITAEPYTHNVDYLDGAPVYGLGVCLSGITTEQSCNFSINDTDVTINTTDDQGNTTTLYHQVTACCDFSDYGDSGGPIYHYYQPQAIAADGVMSSGFKDTSGNWTGQISYSFIQNVKSDLGVVICTSPPTLTGC